MMELKDVRNLDFKLYDSIISHGIYHADSNEKITLKNEAESDFYFDLRRVFGNPEYLGWAADILNYRIHENNSEIISVGGIESGSISLASAIAANMQAVGRPATSFYVRKSEKDHGLRNRIEGIMGTSSVIIEDVVTTGATLRESIEVMEKAGSKPKHAYAVVCRFDRIKELRNSLGVPFTYLYHQSDFHPLQDSVRF